MDIVKGELVSVWSDGAETKTTCELNLKTKEIISVGKTEQDITVTKTPAENNAITNELILNYVTYMHDNTSIVAPAMQVDSLNRMKKEGMSKDECQKYFWYE